MTNAPAAALLAALLLGSAPPGAPQVPASPPAPAAAVSPGDIVAAAPARDWLAIAPEDLIVMTLSPSAGGKPRRVVIQLIAAPISAGWVANIRTLAAAHWWDGTSINRVQDNYVVQWGDASEQKPLPDGIAAVPESAYQVTLDAVLSALVRARVERARLSASASAPTPAAARAAPDWRTRDSYAPRVEFAAGWPVAIADGHVWPVHCYGMVGVARNLSPDTGTGAELYTVIGQAPRHLDRNIALVGRVIEGMAYLSSLPRGTGALGFYETAAERVPIQSVRLASDLPAAERPRYEYLSSESASFARYVAARANRRDPFFIRPAGGVDICNAPVPIRVSAP